MVAVNSKMLLATLAAAGVAGAGDAPDLSSLSGDCETALALSALPERLRADASVFGLRDGAYVKLKDGEGPFTCIVERRHRDSVMPQCVDRAGRDTVLPALIERSERTLAGQGDDAEPDHLAPPARAGVSYMMSDFNYAWVPSAKAILKVAPHVMFYAPGLTNDDIGGSLQAGTENRGTPFMVDPGPHGFMITYTERASSGDDVARQCRGQLGEAPPAFRPFPQGE